MQKTSARRKDQADGWAGSVGWGLSAWFFCVPEHGCVRQVGVALGRGRGSRSEVWGWLGAHRETRRAEGGQAGGRWSPLWPAVPCFLWMPHGRSPPTPQIHNTHPHQRPPAPTHLLRTPTHPHTSTSTPTHLHTPHPHTSTPAPTHPHPHAGDEASRPLVLTSRYAREGQGGVRRGQEWEGGAAAAATALPAAPAPAAPAAALAGGHMVGVAAWPVPGPGNASYNLVHACAQPPPRHLATLSQAIAFHLHAIQPCPSAALPKYSPAQVLIVAVIIPLPPTPHLFAVPDACCLLVQCASNPRGAAAVGELGLKLQRLAGAANALRGVWDMVLGRLQPVDSANPYRRSGVGVCGRGRGGFQGFGVRG